MQIMSSLSNTHNFYSYHSVASINTTAEQASGVIFSKKFRHTLTQLLFCVRDAFYEAEKIERELNLQLPNDEIEYIFSACDIHNSGQPQGHEEFELHGGLE